MVRQLMAFMLLAIARPRPLKMLTWAVVRRLAPLSPARMPWDRPLTPLLNRRRLIMMSKYAWDEEVDLLVLGTGAAGLSAALTGAGGELDVLLVAKSDYICRTTAYSAGTVWAPNNKF